MIQFLLALILFSITTPASAEDTGIGTACDDTCATYAKYTDEAAAVLGECGADPSLSGGDPATTGYNTCRDAVASAWSQIPDYCQAIKLARDAHGEDTIATVAYGAAALTCGVMCVCKGTVLGTIVCGTGGELACAGLGFAASGVDLLANLGLAVFNKEYIETQALNFATSMGAGAVGIGTSAVVTGLNTGANAAGTGTQRESCYATVIFGLIAGAKGAALGGIKSSGDTNCQSVLALDSAIPIVSPDPYANYQQSGATSSGSGKGTSTSGTTASTPAGTASADTGNSGIDAALSSAAKDGKTGSLIRDFKAKDKIDDALGALGSDFGSLKSAIASQGVGNALGNLFGDGGAMFKQIEKDVLAALPRDVSGATYAKGGGAASGSGAAAANPWGMLGKGAGIGGGAAAEMKFQLEQRKPAAATNPDDIWHAGYPGTIFDIVTYKLKQTQDRVEKLGWATPLNRALTGQAARKPASVTGTKKSGGK